MEQVHSVPSVQWLSQERLFEDLMGDMSRGKQEDQQTNLQSNTVLEQIHGKKSPPPSSLPHILLLQSLQTSPPGSDLRPVCTTPNKIEPIGQKTLPFFPRRVREHTCISNLAARQFTEL